MFSKIVQVEADCRWFAFFAIAKRQKMTQYCVVVVVVDLFLMKWSLLMFSKLVQVEADCRWFAFFAIVKEQRRPKV